MSVQDLARCLGAAGDARSPDEQGTYLLYEEDNTLTEKLWSGAEFETQTWVASDVKKNTVAPYLLAPKIRLIFFIDTSDVLKCHKFDEDEEEWVESSLGKAENITVSPDSKLSACFAPQGITVFFQDTAGRLSGIIFKNGSWELLGPIPAKPIAGTPQSLTIVDDKLALFYVGEDRSVHYQVYDHDNNKWQDNVLENSKFETPIDRFMVTKDPEKKLFQSYFLTDGALWHVQGSEEAIKLGKVESGEFIPTTKAQSGYTVYWSYTVVWKYSYSYY